MLCRLHASAGQQRVNPTGKSGGSGLRALRLGGLTLCLLACFAAAVHLTAIPAVVDADVVTLGLAGTGVTQRRGRARRHAGATERFRWQSGSGVRALAALRAQPGVDAGAVGLVAFSEGEWTAPLAALRAGEVLFS